MATIHGTIRGITLLSRANQGAGTTTRDHLEVWLVTADFGAYTGSTDDADILLVSATISARVRDGRTRTLLWGAPAMCGADANNQAVNLCGTAIAALAISTDTLAGELCTVDTVSTEVTATSGTTFGVGILVGVSCTPS
jgi:hypothetical protein